jgi:hypothetical protein
VACEPIHTSIVLRLAGLYGPGRLQLLERLRAGQVRVPRSGALGQSNPYRRCRCGDRASAALADPLPLYLGVDSTPLPLDVLYDALAERIGVDPACRKVRPRRDVGSKRLDNARLRASGFVPRWPDARDGYAALIDPCTAQRTLMANSIIWRTQRDPRQPIVVASSAVTESGHMPLIVVFHAAVGQCRQRGQGVPTQSFEVREKPLPSPRHPSPAAHGAPADPLPVRCASGSRFPSSAPAARSARRTCAIAAGSRAAAC